MRKDAETEGSVGDALFGVWTPLTEAERAALPPLSVPPPPSPYPWALGSRHPRPWTPGEAEAARTTPWALATLRLAFTHRTYTWDKVPVLNPYLPVDLALDPVRLRRWRSAIVRDLLRQEEEIPPDALHTARSWASLSWARVVKVWRQAVAPSASPNSAHKKRLCLTLAHLCLEAPETSSLVRTKGRLENRWSHQVAPLEVTALVCPQSGERPRAHYRMWRETWEHTYPRTPWPIDQPGAPAVRQSVPLHNAFLPHTIVLPTERGPKGHLPRGQVLPPAQRKR